MFGGDSIKLARVFGVRIGIEPSWFVVLFALIYFLNLDYREQFADGTALALAVASALLFFLSVLLHELGHAVVAIRNKIGILGIDLWMLGGVAKMDRDTDSAGVEFRVAVAGPVVTLLIAAGCFGVGSLVSDSGGVADAAVFDSASSDGVLQVLGYLTFINVVLLLFNLIPGFPLDGGRIARAIAWKVTGDRIRATRFAALLGRGFSWLMIAGGAYLLLVEGDVVSGIWLGFVGVFLGQAARGAEQQSILTGRIEGLRVGDVMDDEPVAIPAELTLDRAEEEFFLRYRYPWFPVIDSTGRFVGLITHASVEDLPEAVRAGRTVASVMAAEGDAGDSRLRVGTEEPLESLLSLDGLARLGAVMAVDGEGRLRGIVTADEVRRALSPPASRPAGAQG
ncbi:MAG: site-2 protease family protein [Thermoleophilaceae bacterium]